jgi:hypothetical protein
MLFCKDNLLGLIAKRNAPPPSFIILKNIWGQFVTKKNKKCAVISWVLAAR